MTSQNDDAAAWLIIVVILALFFGGLLWAGYAISAAKCSNRWERSGFKTDFRFVGGCLISKDGKTWIPADNYRELP